MRSTWKGPWAANLLKGALDVLPSLGVGVAAILAFPSERPSRQQTRNRMLAWSCTHFKHAPRTLFAHWRAIVAG